MMFFPDRTGTRRELRRALAPDGRVAVMTWRPLERSHSQAAMAQVWSEYFDYEGIVGT